MTDDEIMSNIRCIREMFPAFIAHYERAAKQGTLDKWAKAVRSVIELVAPNEEPSPTLHAETDSPETPS